MSLQYLTWRQSGAEAEVGVRVRARVVAVERRQAVGRVVIVAATVERPQRSIPHVKWAFCY